MVTRYSNTVSGSELSSELQATINTFSIIGTDDKDGTGSASILVFNAAGDSIASGSYVLARVWIADAEFSEPDPRGAGGDFTVGLGELMRTIEAKADLEILVPATGASVDINNDGAGTVYVMVESNGVVYSSGAIAITVT